MDSDIISQLRRAAMSISLNIAEETGKTGPKDKTRFYSIARVFALECAAILDLLKAWEACLLKSLDTPTEQLEEVVAMLSRMAL